MLDDNGLSRRGFIRTVTGGTAATATAGAVGAQQNGNTSGNQTGMNTTANASQTGGGNQTSGNQTDGNKTGTGSGGGKTHTVGMSGVSFEPASITIAPGDTIVWENSDSQGHTVTAYADNIPDGATYFASGGFDSEEKARSNYPDGTLKQGETFKHTFSTTGTFEYFCIPHESAGMTGTVQVKEGGGGGGGGGAGSGSPEIPNGAKSLGIASTIALGSTLGLAFFFMKYGGDYPED